MTTIRDVARAAGVSTATVSHVINQSRAVSPQTRERVEQAISDLRYRRDAIARSLRRSTTGTLGLVVSDISNPFFGDLVRGLEDAVHDWETPFNVILCNTDEDPEKERKSLDVLRERRVDGVVMVPAGGNEAYLREMIAGGLPVVLADRYLAGVPADAVVVDNRESACRIVSRLTAGGHRRIAVLHADLNASAIDERMAGYADALAGMGIAPDPIYNIRCHSSIECARDAGLQLLDLPVPPTAVFCTNNFMTLGLVQALAHRKLRCPRDLAVVGFDDFPWASAFHPQLTVVSQPAYAIGRAAASLLLDRLSGRYAGKPIRSILEARLIVRASCGTAGSSPVAASREGADRGSAIRGAL